MRWLWLERWRDPATDETLDREFTSSISRLSQRTRASQSSPRSAGARKGGKQGHHGKCLQYRQPTTGLC